jgi:hypothetical protein
MDTTPYPQARLRTEYAEFTLFWIGLLTFVSGIITSSVWAAALGFFLTLITGLIGFRPD